MEKICDMCALKGGYAIYWACLHALAQCIVGITVKNPQKTVFLSRPKSVKVLFLTKKSTPLTKKPANSQTAVCQAFSVNFCFIPYLYNLPKT